MHQPTLTSTSDCDTSPSLLYLPGRRLGLIGILTLVILTSCASVKEYQKNKLNDSEMSLGNRKAEKSELNFQSYREGASGANGGKSGGGCGCN